MNDDTFSSVRFSRNHTYVTSTTTPAELLALVNRPEFDLVVAEVIGGDDFAQVVDLGGVYRFEVADVDAPTGTMLATPEDVVAAFADWATGRPGWRDEHDWD